MIAQAQNDAAVEQLLREIGRIVDERFGPRAEGARYLIGHLQQLLLTPAQTPLAAICAQSELTLDQLEDVLEALGVDTWT